MIVEGDLRKIAGEYFKRLNIQVPPPTETYWDYDVVNGRVTIEHRPTEDELHLIIFKGTTSWVAGMCGTIEVKIDMHLPIWTHRSEPISVDNDAVIEKAYDQLMNDYWGSTMVETEYIPLDDIPDSIEMVKGFFIKAAADYGLRGEETHEDILNWYIQEVELDVLRDSSTKDLIEYIKSPTGGMTYEDVMFTLAQIYSDDESELVGYLNSFTTYMEEQGHEPQV